jgi:endo-1,4-beta-xylanase
VVRTAEVSGPVTKKAVKYRIYLPPDYDTSTERYPVSYFLHGLNGDESSHNDVVLPALEEAVAEGVVPPMVVVFPNGYRDVYWGDAKDGSKPAETSVIRELIPHIDSTYRTIADREHRAILGYSMGGYGAVLYAVKFPDLFGTCVSYDGALHTWESLSQLRPATTGELYGGDESHFSNHSPWVQAVRNADGVRSRVAIRLVVGGIRVLNRHYRRHLSELGIPVDYVETDCGHDLRCVMREAGRESFAFIAAHLGAAAD